MTNTRLVPWVNDGLEVNPGLTDPVLTRRDLTAGSALYDTQDRRAVRFNTGLRKFDIFNAGHTATLVDVVSRRAGSSLWTVADEERDVAPFDVAAPSESITAYCISESVCEPRALIAGYSRRSVTRGPFAPIDCVRVSRDPGSPIVGHCCVV